MSGHSIVNDIDNDLGSDIVSISTSPIYMSHFHSLMRVTQVTQLKKY